MTRADINWELLRQWLEKQKEDPYADMMLTCEVVLKKMQDIEINTLERER